MLNTVAEIESVLYTLRVAEVCLEKTSGLFCSDHKKIRYWTSEGLCHLLGKIMRRDIRDKDHISRSILIRELHKIAKYRTHSNGYYWWKPGQVRPRLKFIRKAIKEFEADKHYLMYGV